MSSWINGNLTGTLSVGRGEPGKSLEYEWRGTWLGIRREGEEEYQFVNLAGEGTGTGREIELQVGNGYIQWRYKGGEEWNNLIAIADLKGEPGPQGIPGRDGQDGLNGENGKSLEFNWNGTELGVRREGDNSYSYVDLRGRDGQDGTGGGTTDWQILKEIILEEEASYVYISKFVARELIVHITFGKRLDNTSRRVFYRLGDGSFGDTHQYLYPIAINSPITSYADISTLKVENISKNMIISNSSMQSSYATEYVDKGIDKIGEIHISTSPYVALPIGTKIKILWR